jgi:hypothetical protein
MQTGDRPDPFRIAGGLLLFVFAALTPARSSPKKNTATVPRPAGRFLLFSALTSAPCAVRR